jgi:biopolymer transport protein ExbD
MQPGIKINLPKAVTSEVVKYDNIDIAISAENIIYVNGKVMTTQELKGLLRQVAKRDVSILIKADKRASLGRVVEIWDMCRDLGVTHVNIATNQE